jgi:CheY-like chemotaxis protein
MILIVDDHDDTRYILVRLLKATGYDAIGVSDGNQALTFLQTHKPTLIILDCHMPCLDGFGVLRAVRAHAELAHTPVLMFSADPEAKHHAMRHGANGFIIKGSLDWAQLSAAVEKYMGNRQSDSARPPGGNFAAPSGG